MMKKWKRVPVVTLLIFTLIVPMMYRGWDALAYSPGQTIQVGMFWARVEAEQGGKVDTVITSFVEGASEAEISREMEIMEGGHTGKKANIHAVGNGSFNSDNTNGLRKVSIEEVIIMSDAFKQCPDLEKIEFRSGAIIESNAFNNLPNLKEIEFESSVNVRSGAFINLPNLKKLDLSTLGELEEGTFTNCTGLQEVTLDYDRMSAKRMSDNSFPGCSSVLKVNLIYPYDSKESNKELINKITSSLPGAKINGILEKNRSVDNATENPELNKTELKDFPMNSEPYKLNITNLYATLTDDMKTKDETIEKEELKGVYTWSSDRPEVASVDNNGNVTPHVPGKAVITLTVANDGRSKSAECAVNVTAPRCGDYEFDPDTGIIYGYHGTDTKVSVPEKLGGIPVKKIAANAFEDCTTIENLIIPSTITDIGETAFKGCTALKNMVIPNCIKTIATDALEGITDLNIKVLYSGETDESGTPVIRHSVFEAAGIDDKITGYIIGVTPEYKPVLNMTEIKDLKAGSDPVELTVSGLYPENLPAEINESNSSMEPLVVKWKSSKPSVAQVSSDGLVTPISAGTAVITADIQGRSVSCKVQVTGGSLTVAEPDGMKLTEAARAVLAKTEPIKSAVAAGQDTTVLMIFEEKGKNEVADDAQAIDDILKEGQEAAAYYNIAFQAVIDGRMPVNVNETAGNIELEFSLDGIKKAASYKVARVHNGQAELLNAKLSPEEETLTAGSSLFSTYAIIREQENIQTPLKENENTVKIVKKPKSPVRSSLDTTPAKTGDNSHTAGVAGLTFLMLAILLRVGRNSLIKHK